jgi:hypothetical protein
LFDSRSKLTEYGWASKSRYDDFVGVHINMTTTIHNTGNFLGYHRYFLHTYEKALRDECGYTGYAPVSIFAQYLDVTNLSTYSTGIGSNTEMMLPSLLYSTDPTLALAVMENITSTTAPLLAYSRSSCQVAKVVAA